MSINQQSNATQLFSEWHITAYLEDNTVINQENFCGEINRNREKVRYLGLYWNNQLRGLVELVNPEQRLILVRRVREIRGEENLQLLGKQVVLLVGWQSTVNGKNTKALLYLCEDGIFTLKNSDGRLS
jgi:hypothetical protein